ncbi:autotransporter outer membrane beta-barrel domain-containing protein [Lawsonia intracellularis]|uniref:NA n=2 Tax=Lawsonia intracellularis TaxID=29546 RepID=Q1MNS2_LAWIP|nr:autotransporter domain-containing protein [Lawsonia intracellularis]AGC50725.1 hypothetical protein LAW_30057 [Lawsonia intracellularis N343]KAA0204160.1 autotransporter domain-containing protein [Lawsonia intracellularis]MBZ3893332.1 autotransporter outer membrane beta-barrel domain-containing protein [Lawsonia intracellularis]RBN31983.1 autotransporter domain-containing protein [Lawsonia intracellularis]RBN32682.1 autotransporter domain-containing protein [Lawsonia intracellularis]
MLFKLFWITISNVKKIIQCFSFILYICFCVEDVFAMYNNEECGVSNAQSVLENPAVAHPNTSPEFFIITEDFEKTEEEENTGCCPTISSEMYSESCPNPFCHPLEFYGTMRSFFSEGCHAQCSSFETVLTSGCIVFQWVGNLISSLFSEEDSSTGECQREKSCYEEGNFVSTPVITPPNPLGQQGSSSRCSSGSKIFSSSSGPIKESVFISSGYNYQDQRNALASMRHVLLDVSTQLSMTLRDLVLKGYQERLNTGEAYALTYNRGARLTRKPVKQMKYFSTSGSSMRHFNVFQALKLYQANGSIDSQKYSIEDKISPEQVGCIVDITSNVSLGIVYGHQKGKVKEYKGNVSSALGILGTTLDVDSFSTMVMFDLDKVGIMGSLSTCYGWGKAKNIRRFSRGGKEVHTKGSSSISSVGGLIHIGYPIDIRHGVSMTPYIEYMVSMVQRGGYQEKLGLLPCSFTDDMKIIHEKRIGLCSNWKPTPLTCLQIWIAGTSGMQKTKGVYSTLSVIPNQYMYTVSFPVQKEQYLQAEFGLSYQTALTETAHFYVNGTSYIKKVQKNYGGQHVFFQLRYTF